MTDPLLAALFFCLICSKGALAQEPFTIIILPDTQAYTTPGLAGRPELFSIQTQWIADNKNALNIAFVLHEGDITNNNDDPGWANARAGLDILDGVVPYVLAVGNHDGLGSGTNNTEKFNQIFPVSEFRGLSTFGDVFEPGKMENCYHLFSAGGVDWLVFSIEFGPHEAVLEWANQVAADHPDRKIIVVTHTHIYSDDLHHGSSPDHRWVPTTDYGRENNGDDVWRKFLKNHANSAFVFNGHVLNDGQGRRVDFGDHGNPVYQMLCNYQMIENGGNGFLRIIRLFPSEDRLEATSYSPYLDQYNTNPQHQFEYTNLGIFEDSQPPFIETLHAEDETHIRVRYSEPMEENSATDIVNYSIGRDVEVLSALLNTDMRTVTLGTTNLAECITYLLTVSNVSDRASPANTIAADTARTFVLEPVLLDDDFDDGDLSGWAVVDEGSISSPSNWHVAGGRIVQTSNIYGPSAQATENRKGSFVYWDDVDAFSWSDYAFSVKLQMTDDDGIGVMFRYRDSNNYYKVDLDRQRKFRKLFRMKDGMETTLATVAGTYSLNAEMLMQVEVIGNRFSVTLEGVDIFSGPVTDTAGGLNAGTIALYVWGNDGACFDDVKVEAINSCSCQDVDEDGHENAICGGDDCNDNDGNIHPEVEDVCGDFIDNDCDGLIDDPDTCVSLDGGDDAGTDADLDAHRDAGDPVAEQDAGGVVEFTADGGCGCNTSGAENALLIPLLLLFALSLSSRRKRMSTYFKAPHTLKRLFSGSAGPIKPLMPSSA